MCAIRHVVPVHLMAGLRLIAFSEIDECSFIKVLYWLLTIRLSGSFCYIGVWLLPMLNRDTRADPSVAWTYPRCYTIHQFLQIPDQRHKSRPYNQIRDDIISFP